MILSGLDFEVTASANNMRLPDEAPDYWIMYWPSRLCLGSSECIKFVIMLSETTECSMLSISCSSMLDMPTCLLPTKVLHRLKPLLTEEAQD